MATIVLASVGMAVGGSIGGTVMGLSMAAAGRFVGATVGRVIDQRLMGAGSESVEIGRIDRFRLTSASEGSAVSQLYGRLRIPGQVIWASRFKERKKKTEGSGGKGSGGSQPSTTSYSYSVSMALALCEGEISRVGRVWADGVEVSPDDLNMRVYSGSQTQLPDPKIEVIEGVGMAPAYRGTAYVVLEDLQLAQFNNRVPQFTFEVMRGANDTDSDVPEVSNGVQAVALVPGTGEYALATTPVYYQSRKGANKAANINSPSGKTDFLTSVEALNGELPNCGSALLVVSWFGNDLRCGSCSLKPKVEQNRDEAFAMPWTVSGLNRSEAEATPLLDGRPVYGGTPTDQSVIQAIKHLKKSAKMPVFYPFILMDQLDENGLVNPYTGGENQPALPWRGRITLDYAPTHPDTSDQTPSADAQVAQFFGNAHLSDFQSDGSTVRYTGPEEWSYRRFILHYAHLCKLAGGIDAFCIGSEMRGLTQIRGENGFPAVDALRALAADVRTILPDTKISYASDWSEYFGYHPQDGSGDVYFHLDDLWADENIDFIGIDNYMPLSDWRDGPDHADADWGAIHNLEYLQSNIEGGEGYDWYYHSPESREAQIRTPIKDHAHGEDWIYRYKDLRGWWENPHHNRINGVRSEGQTPWVPMSKPFWFTEYGCAAIDKGTNQPNKFLDPKSSESSVPYYSTGVRDDMIQMQYLRAMMSYWGMQENNPVSELFDGPMVDMSRAHVWAWDARPYPFFPNNQSLWSDGRNYARGHWLNGRSSSRALSEVVREITLRSGVSDVDVSALYGVLRGYAIDEVTTARSALQPLMTAFGFEAIERDGKLIFRTRNGRIKQKIAYNSLAVTDENDSVIEATRAPSAEISGRVRLNFIENDGDYEARTVEATFPDEITRSTSQTELPIGLTQGEGQRIVERWLAEARVARDSIQFALPPSEVNLGAGDVVEMASENVSGFYRIDRVEDNGVKLAEAVRIDPSVYHQSDMIDSQVAVKSFTPPVPVLPMFMDIPLMSGDEIPHAPHIAITATPWPGSVAIYGSSIDNDYVLKNIISQRATIGETKGIFRRSQYAVIDRTITLRVELFSGELSSTSAQQLLSGANLAAISGNGSTDWELFQFETAILVEKDTYELSGFLRGQLGTDALVPDVWPENSTFVLIDSAVEQIDLSSQLRDVVQNYRIGPAQRGYDDPSYSHHVEAFRGVGLRPYAPCHLKLNESNNGDINVSWIRRTRISGDNWNGLDVPLGEAREAYLVRVMSDNKIIREVTSETAEWTYSGSMQTEDNLMNDFSVEIAQISEQFGPGPFARIDASLA
ncbi:baseplate multidomain protein megatron [Parasulfitobacter algicola]|uniref:Glycoside hydrolase/phage tail family protein n=1 Tax=Parasulfitobacter algicola TaxID=2614809 RepID=A0ABX2IW49_9RHOB|nr:glycoside hydrolase/phage tail family protein [Sulfitobacter algicola]NSX56246.1 glycoside hydrolase/phage tail family protein [Sulfitobacter algicola]